MGKSVLHDVIPLIDKVMRVLSEIGCDQFDENTPNDDPKIAHFVRIFNAVSNVGLSCDYWTWDYEGVDA
jgi:hypothetical protein